MFTALIIESDPVKRTKLAEDLYSLDSSIFVKEHVGTIKEAVAWFKNNLDTDLVFMRAQLDDGPAYSLFEQVNVNCPVILFGEGGDESLFNLPNVIGYFLLPHQKEQIAAIIKKYQTLKSIYFRQFEQTLEMMETSKKQRIVVKKGVEISWLKPEDAAFFYTVNNIVFVMDAQGNKFTVDKKLFLLQNELDSNMFFRATKKYLVNIHAILKYKPLPNSKIKIYLEPDPGEEIIISSVNTNNFRKWFSGEKG